MDLEVRPKDPSRSLGFCVVHPNIFKGCQNQLNTRQIQDLESLDFEEKGGLENSAHRRNHGQAKTTQDSKARGEAEEGHDRGMVPLPLQPQPHRVLLIPQGVCLALLRRGSNQDRGQQGKECHVTPLSLRIRNR